ncbi:MAG: hypothetical protein HY788_08915 [Deltaproteobacteria bacterium]|nr:hypothetical protein [Deltaproteobacteria bacterium]
MRRIVPWAVCVFCAMVWMPFPAWAEVLDGIWKDAPKDGTGERYAVYLQTYDTGSAVAVLLDNSGGQQRLYAFLDSDFTDGFEADELGGANAHLSMSFGDQGAGTPGAGIRIGEITETVSLYRWFEADPGGTSGNPADGIYKNEPAPQDASVNLFLQTYPNEGSAVAIFTSSGGVEYYAFLQSDYAGGFDVDDLLGGGRHFQAAISAPGGSSFTITAPSSQDTGLLHKWFQAPMPAADYELQGVLLFNGAPMSGITAETPTFFVVNDVTGKTAGNFIAEYDPSSAAYELRNMPSVAGISVNFHVTGTEATLPGNYTFYKSVDIASLTEGERLDYDLDAYRILHLLTPYDNSQIAPGSYLTEYPEYPTPVAFQWEAIPGAEFYSIRIARYRDASHPEGFGLIETIVYEDVQGTSYQADLERKRHRGVLRLQGGFALVSSCQNPVSFFS